jgi:sirohydrochlorin cobaltochelatase
MILAADTHAALAELDVRLNTLLPPEYQDVYEDVQPVSMGSAGLLFRPDGRVAWDLMWRSFCDLAMAGGPPHKGTLLEPGSRAAVGAEPERHAEVVKEICRGVVMVTGLRAAASPVPGWVRVRCPGDSTTGWLLRAMVMENVAARAEGSMLDLPAAPAFRLEKEIKNVVTVVAKTCHYWLGHTPRAQQQAIGELFVRLNQESPLAVPAIASEADAQRGDEAVVGEMADAIHRDTGLRLSQHRYAGWLGVEMPNVRAAVWMMRATVVGNVLARREGMVLFVPVPGDGEARRRVVRVVAQMHSLAAAKGVL